MTIEWGTKITIKIDNEKNVENDIDEYSHANEEVMNLAYRVEIVLTNALVEKEYKSVNN